MRKQYFGKDKVNNLPPMYVVKLLDGELEKFTKHMEEWGFEKHCNIPEIMDCKENEYAIGYDIEDNKEKELFEEAYKEYKLHNPTGKTREVKVLQGFYDGAWSDLCEYELWETKELKDNYRDYQKNEPCPHRIITRRIKNEY